MPRFAAFQPAKYTIATAYGHSTARNGPYPDQLSSSSPVRLEAFQPAQSNEDAVDASAQFTPLNKWNPLNWIFGFLRDGTTSVPSTSKALGHPTRNSLFRQRQATSGLLKGATAPPTGDSEEKTLTKAQSFPPWSSWKDWKKISLDLYIRLLDTPQYSRLRLKQTIAPLPIFKLKPVIDLAYRGPSKSPITMHMDVKLLDCIKYRLHTDGSSHLQVRARAPMSDPRFTMDIIYERQLGTSLDSVKITFRALNVAFLKAPSPGFGIKMPIRFNSGIKSTIRVKKFIDRANAAPDNSTNDRKSGRGRHLVNTKVRTSSRYNKHVVPAIRTTQHRDYTRGSQIGIFGPIGVDIKLRCLEYR